MRLRPQAYLRDDHFSCTALDSGPFAPLFAEAGAPCRARPTCACLGLDGSHYQGGIECTVPPSECGYVGCVDDDAGGVSLQYHVPCYGAPPARVG